MANISIADRYTSSDIKTELFSDFGVNLQLHPGKRDLVRTTNEAAIRRSIINLILTDYHERLYQPYLGANLKQLLFEPATEDTLSMIQHKILTCIKRFEPRAEVISVRTTLSPDEHQVQVVLTYSVVNTTTPVTLNLLLNRVR